MTIATFNTNADFHDYCDQSDQEVKAAAYRIVDEFVNDQGTKDLFSKRFGGIIPVKFRINKRSNAWRNVGNAFACSLKIGEYITVMIKVRRIDDYNGYGAPTKTVTKGFYYTNTQKV